VGSTEVMKGHRAERAGVNIKERKRLQRNALLGADARVCPEQANTQEKTLAMAGLVRDSPSFNTYGHKETDLMTLSN